MILVIPQVYRAFSFLRIAGQASAPSLTDLKMSSCACRKVLNLTLSIRPLARTKPMTSRKRASLSASNALVSKMAGWYGDSGV